MFRIPTTLPAALITWLLALGAPSGTVAADDVAIVVGRIEAAHRDANDLQADFTQTTRYEGFSTPAVSKGRLSIQRPEKMRWDYREPSRHQIYVNGDEVIYLVPEHQQAIRSTMAREARSPIPLMLLAGTATLSKQFAVAPDGEAWRGADRYRLRLTGKAGDAALMPLTIEADAKAYLIRRVTLHDPSGAQTTFEFSNVTLNKGLDAGLFRFTPPAGIEIVDAPPLLPQGAPAPRDEIIP